MIRKSDLLWLSVATFAGVTLFHTSYQVQGLREEKANLDHQIASENDGIQVLKAEWSFLNDPSRLEQLAAAHLTLKPITGMQVASFDALPIRPAAPPIPVNQPVAPTASAPAQVRKAITPAPGASVTMASVQAPVQPSGQVLARAHKQVRPQHPGDVRPTLAVASASAGGGVSRYRGGDEIGALLSRLGHIQ